MEQQNPYAPPAEPPRSPQPDAASPPAGFWWRVLAWLLDIVVLLPLYLLQAANLRWWGIAAISLAIAPLEVSYRFALDAGGGTIGKRLLGMRLIDPLGDPPGARRALLRNLHHIAVAAFALLIALDIVVGGNLDGETLMPLARAYQVLLVACGLAVAIRRDKRGLHDLWSGVRCVRAARTAAPAIAR